MSRGTPQSSSVAQLFSRRVTTTTFYQPLYYPLLPMADASPPNSTTTTDDTIEHKPAPPPKERRFKLSRACDRCRRRRIKCDEGHPCQSCLAASAACTFEEPGKRTHPHKSKRATTLEDRMQQLESLIQAIPFNLLMPAVQAATSSSNTNQPGGASPKTNTSPNASFASATHAYPLSVPPPSLSLFPLMNPSTRFPTAPPQQHQQHQHQHQHQQHQQHTSIPQARRSFEGASVSPSYLYLDDEGYTRWQGESSGLPLLDFLVDTVRPGNPASSSAASPSSMASPIRESWSRKSENVTTGDWFPDRQPRSVPVQPEAMWRLITSMIAPELMDSLVQCFLSTTYYLMPFLHVPTFLADYGNPAKWGEPGFASFIVAVCCLSSRHIDDPRVRADPNDGFSAGAHWFELFTKLRTVPAADRPTLYTVQAVFVAGVYAIGLGRLSKGFALLAEACTLCVDAGLHRSSEAYDCFGPIEEQVRRRTFWCVYMWDKQGAGAFGRPPVMRLRDCDALEPDEVDDEYVTGDAVGPQPAHKASRLGAFVACARLCVILEAVLTAPQSVPPCSPFLVRASALLSPPRGFSTAAASSGAAASSAAEGSGSGSTSDRDLQREEALLNDILASVPAYWAHTRETMGSADVLRVTQAERLHCLVLFVRMFIERYRFSRRVVARIHASARGEGGGGIGSGNGINGNGGGEGEQQQQQTDAEREAMLACHACAVELVHEHTQVAKKGLMTYCMKLLGTKEENLDITVFFSLVSGFYFLSLWIWFTDIRSLSFCWVVVAFFWCRWRTCDPPTYAGGSDAYCCVAEL